MSIEVTIGKTTVPFTVWRPGSVLNGPYLALDTETEMITPGSVPRLVIASVTDGEQGYFVAQQHVAAFIQAHPNAIWLMHNAAFDIPVLEQYGAALIKLVESGRVFDTGLLYRLLKLADSGNCHGAWSLDYLAKSLLNVDLPKDVMSADGQPVRTSYGRFLREDGTPDYVALTKPENRAYLTYAAGDPLATWLVGQVLKQKAHAQFGPDLDIFDRATYSTVSQIDQTEVGLAWQTHGLLTHDIQLKASLALADVERHGMCIDAAKIDDAVANLDQELASTKTALKNFGWQPGTGSHLALDTILADIEKRVLHEQLPRTETGKYSRRADDLDEYRNRSKFIDAYLRYEELNKMRSTFLAPLERGGHVARGRFNVLVNTGRTSCGGSRDEQGDRVGLNLQNLPREGSIRQSLMASPGHYLFACDYSAIELTTLSQHCIARFGHSKMADAIKRGADLHALDAAFRVGLDINKLPSWDKKTILNQLGPDADKLRDKSKAKNFGLPGGLGAKTFVEYARTAYGVELREEQAKEEKEQWLRMWPEMENHLASNDMEAFGTRYMDLWTKHPKVWDGANFTGTPWPVHVFKGILCGQVKTKTTERPYNQAEIEWAWSAAERVAQDAPALSVSQRATLDSRIRERIAGNDLWHMLAPRQRHVATLTGRLRGYPTYCAAKNCPFQGLAADGAKKALYRLYREGFRIVNFIHDEFLIEFPIEADHTALAEKVKSIMIAEMQSVVPDLPVSCEYALMRRWYKGAKALYEDGKLVPAKPVATSSGKITWVRDDVE